MATDLDISKWLVNNRVKNEDKISSGPYNRTYPKVLKSTSLLQVQEILQEETFVAVIDSEKSKGNFFKHEKKISNICYYKNVVLGCSPTATKFKVFGVITLKEILNFMNKKSKN